jgi:hypothetical protein
LTQAHAPAWRFEMAAVSWAAIAWVLRPSPVAPDFHTRSATIRSATVQEFFARLALVCIVLLVTLKLTETERHQLAPHFVVGLSLVFSIGWLVSAFFWNRESHVLLAKIAGAPRLPFAQADGHSGTCEGTVTASSPVRVGNCDAAMGLEVRWSNSQRNSTEKGRKLLANGRFSIVTPEGRVHVDPDECLWATTTTNSEKHSFETVVSEWVAVGGKVAAFGRFVAVEKHDGGTALRLSSMGTRPALLLSASDRGDPLRLARRIVFNRRLTLGGLVLLGVVLGWLIVDSPM